MISFIINGNIRVLRKWQYLYLFNYRQPNSLRKILDAFIPQTVFRISHQNVSGKKPVYLKFGVDFL